MSLHRLLGFRAAVVDPTALDAYYAELGLTGDAGSGYTGSDGGAIVTLLEMAFAGRCGLELRLDGWAEATLRSLFNEELGAVVQIAAANREAFEQLLVKYNLAGMTHHVGRPKEKLGIKLHLNGETAFKWNFTELFRAWNETSSAMQRLRDNPQSADQESDWRLDDATRRF